MLAVIASVVRDIVCFVPLACILPMFYGIDGVLWAAPVSDFVAIIVAVVLTVLYFKKLKPKQEKEAERD